MEANVQPLDGVTKSRSKQAIGNAKTLFDVIQKRRDLEKQEKELKAFFQALLPKGGVLNAGTKQVVVAPDSRHTLVRDLVRQKLGEEGTKECERETTFFKVSVLDLTSLH